MLKTSLKIGSQNLSLIWNGNATPGSSQFNSLGIIAKTGKAPTVSLIPSITAKRFDGAKKYAILLPGVEM